MANGRDKRQFALKSSHDKKQPDGIASQSRLLGAPTNLLEWLSATTGYPNHDRKGSE
ncbi:MAG: hypothetical protein ACO2PK_10340 [Armatimonadota bacterium]